MFKETLEKTGEVGFAEKVISPLVYVSGLPNVTVDETVIFENDVLGQVHSMDGDFVEILTFSEVPVRVGMEVTRTAKELEVVVGDFLLGHSINPLGRSLYESDPVPQEGEKRFMRNVAPGISTRKEIKRTLDTGVTVVDLLIPLGKGQRELVIGDRKIGKTNFLLQTMLSQARQGSVCIYAGIGRKKVDVRKVEKFFDDAKIRDKTIIISAAPSDSLGLIYITPYVAMTIAEYFKDKGQDVLLVLDDLTSHAKFYREFSLLAHRFPGRGSYPGDIFYTHAKLLERAGNFVSANEAGEVAITCLPVAETVEADITGYIQTNLMSITDGHIFFDKDIFVQGRRPAVNYFLSVTRVGRQTQSKVRWGANRELNNFLSLFERTQGFVHFGAELSEGIKATIDMGVKIHRFFEQRMSMVLSLNVQIMLFCLIWIGTWKEKNEHTMQDDLARLVDKYDKDDQFKKKIDEMVIGAGDFNDLLGRVNADASEILMGTHGQ